MTAKKILPYGSWPSPVSARDLASTTISFGDIVLDGDLVYWSETRPADDGRTVVVCRDSAGNIRDVTSREFSVRSRVHEYGGGAYTAVGGNLYFVNDKDQQIYIQAPGSARPVALTARENCRYADLIYDNKHNQIICVEEDHSGARVVVNTLVAISLTRNAGRTVLAENHDFFSSPVLSKNCEKLAWLVWDHPNMPWDGSELWCASLTDDGRTIHPEKVAGSKNESIFQPQWSPDNQLYFISDRSGWWNIYRFDNKDTVCVYADNCEFGLPQWVFSMSTYSFLNADTIICSFNQNGIWHLAQLDTITHQFTVLDLPFVTITGIRAQNDKAVFIGSSIYQNPALVLKHGISSNFEVIRKSGEGRIPDDYISKPEQITFSTSGDNHAFGFFYRPVNGEYEGSKNELPPLLVKTHGGPTAATNAAYNPKIQFWTSRGFAVLDVNYRGSTGYGRQYRELLNGKWGIIDTEDCINGALYLAGKGMVDHERMAISGSSAGGYTVLCALTFHNVFKTGASLYGISELEALARDTHKFESRYLETLIGPYPQEKSKYFDRSPVNFTDNLSVPIAFFQGSEDKVVPPIQAEMMVEALDKKGLPVAYELYSGEQHGFRKAENIMRAIEGELYFYSRIFGFELPEYPYQIEIRNF